tara:strand:- start:1158 stop:1370 length:213 start_codon:yes stop_codon:yes gene_type:complete
MSRVDVCERAATMSSAVTRARARVTLGLGLALVIAAPAVSFASRPWDVTHSVYKWRMHVVLVVVSFVFVV